MTPEKQHSESNEPSSDMKDFIDDDFRNHKLYQDAFNELHKFLSRLSDDDLNQAVLKQLRAKKLRHYEQRLLEHEGAENVDYILSKSDSNLVKEFNELVDIINSEGEAIIGTRDTPRLKEINQRIAQLRKDSHK